MKLILTVFGLMMVLTFGAISAVDNSGGVVASTTSPSAVNCHDDGDDDPPSNEEPVDAPDSDDNEAEENPGGRDDEPGDGEDSDPVYEEDDEANCDLGPTGILADTETPSPTPCPTYNDESSASGLDCCPEAGPVICCPPGFQSAGIDAEQIDPCFCYYYPYLCCNSAGGDVGAELICCDYAEGEVGAELGICCLDAGAAAAEEVAPEFICLGVGGDADCDGEVTSADAFETLVQLGGWLPETAGCSSGSDADCSGALDAKDALAILKILAGFAEPANC